MANIPYPNVPPLPGVPALSRSAPYVAAALTLVSEFLPLNLFGQPWGIFFSDTRQYALIPDSFVSFEYKQESKIPTYPLQYGAFQSYNKVRLPYELRVTVTCSGNGSMRKQAFLERINTLLKGLNTVDVVTPEFLYSSANLVHVDYRRESNQGATLIIAQLWFQWVRVINQPTNKTAKPSGASPDGLGTLTPITSPSAALITKVSSIF